MATVDFINVWGLIMIGFFLFIGLFTRWISVAGIVLLLFYYIAYPPFPIRIICYGLKLIVFKTHAINNCNRSGVLKLEI